MHTSHGLDISASQEPDHALSLAKQTVNRLLATGSLPGTITTRNLAFARSGQPDSIATGDREMFADIERLHAETMLEASSLRLLIDADCVRQELARCELSWSGGFLHTMLEVGASARRGSDCAISYGSDGLQGYCSVVSNPADVQEECKRLFGWSHDQTYRQAENLPAKSETGTLYWTNPARALEVFTRTDRLAVSPEVAVRKRVGGEPLRGRGLASNLFRAVCRTLPRDAFILGEIFTIRAVDGVPVIPSVANRASERVQEKLGAEKIGILHEHLEGQGGVALDVDWGLWLLPVANVLDRISA